MISYSEQHEISSFFRAFDESTKQAAKSRATIVSQKAELFKKTPSTLNEMDDFLKLNQQLNSKEGKLIKKYIFAIEGGKQELKKIKHIFKAYKNKESSDHYNQFLLIEKLVERSFLAIEEHFQRFYHRLEREESLIKKDLSLVERKKRFANIKKLVQVDVNAEKTFVTNLKKDYNQTIKEIKKVVGDGVVHKMIVHWGLGTTLLTPGIAVVLAKLNDSYDSVTDFQAYLILGVCILMAGMSSAFAQSLMSAKENLRSAVDV